ncbi:MAG: hypothetical protein R3B72_48970 [Polyangiaceae bacterium]
MRRTTWMVWGTLGALVTGCGTSDIIFGTGGAGGEGEVGGSGGSGTGVAQGGSGTGVGGSGTGTGVGGAGGSGGECGDGMVSGAESCDGDDLAGADCTAFGFSSPAGLACDGSCQLDPSGCSASCDGQLLEPGEDCDGMDLGGMDCTLFGYSSPGGATCTEACTVDPSGCSATCDGQLLEPGEDCDGMDLGGADCTGFGFVSPAGLACTNCGLDASGCTAVCGNMVVEPGEGCDDNTSSCNNCQLGGGTTCGDAIQVSQGLGTATYTGTTVGGGLHNTNSCNGAQQATDRVYLVTPLASGFLTASLTRPTTDYDALLYALSDCLDPGSTIQCVDAWDPNDNTATGGEVISFEVQAGVPVYLVVDGFGNQSGNYELKLDLSVGTCADPVPFPIWAGVPMRGLGNTNNKPNTQDATCGGGMAGEVVYEVMPQQAGNLDVRLPANPTNYDAVLAARSVCTDPMSELDCDRDPNGGNDENFGLSTTSMTNVFVIVDGFAGSEGDYVLRLDP